MRPHSLSRVPSGTTLGKVTPNLRASLSLHSGRSELRGISIRWWLLEGHQAAAERTQWVPGKKKKELLEGELIYIGWERLIYISLEAELIYITVGNSLNGCLFSMCTCTLKKAHAIQGRVINVDSVEVSGTVLQVHQLVGLRLAFFFFFNRL